MLKRILGVLLSLAIAHGAAAQTINNLGAGAAVSGTDLFPAYQGANPATAVSAAQIKTYIYGLMTGDCTVSGNTVTCTKTNGAAFGSLATAVPGTGVATAISNAANAAGGFTTIDGAATLTNKTFNCANNTCTVRIASDVSGLGTGVASALGNATNGANGFVTLGASFQSSPALTPAGTSSTSAVMAGMGSTCAITPTSTGRIRFTIEGRASNNTSGDGVNLQLLWGIGTAPTNGAAAAGSSPSGLNMTLITTASGLPPASFSLTGQVTGRTLGTALWFDVSQNAVTGGTATIGAAACNAYEY